MDDSPDVPAPGPETRQTSRVEARGGALIAVCSDEAYPVHAEVCRELTERGYSVLPFGSLVDGAEHPWANVAERAALAVARGEASEGIFFCWSGTGICMAANKVFGIRAALCSDPGQVRAARVWNHANVLCLSNRTLSRDMAKEMIAAWFETDRGTEGAAGVATLHDVAVRHRVSHTDTAKGRS